MQSNKGPGHFSSTLSAFSRGPSRGCISRMFLIPAGLACPWFQLLSSSHDLITLPPPLVSSPGVRIANCCYLSLGDLVILNWASHFSRLLDNQSLNSICLQTFLLSCLGILSIRDRVVLCSFHKMHVF